MKIPVIPIAIIAGQALTANAGGGDVGAKLMRFASYYVGFDAGSGVFDPNALKIGLLPWAVYGVTKRFLFPLIGNPNRYLARARVPISL